MDTPPTLLPLPGDTLADELARLVGLFLDNERLLTRLSSLNRQLESARDYLVRPHANVVLGMATLHRVKRLRRSVLTQLRANRLQADELLQDNRQPISA